MPGQMRSNDKYILRGIIWRIVANYVIRLLCNAHFIHDRFNFTSPLTSFSGC